MSCRTLIIRGRRVLVVTPRSKAPAVRGMAARKLPVWAICAALRMKRDRVAAICAATLAAKGSPSIWGELAGVLAEELRRVA